MVLVNDNEAHYRVLVDPRVAPDANRDLFIELTSYLSGDQEVSTQVRLTNLEKLFAEDVTQKNMKIQQLESKIYSNEHEIKTLKTHLELKDQQIKTMGLELTALKSQNDSLTHSLDETVQKLRENEDKLNQESRTVKDLSVLLDKYKQDLNRIDSRIDDMDLDEDERAEPENDDQLVTLAETAQSGFRQTSPASSPVKIVRIKCNECNSDFSNQSDLKTHSERWHKPRVTKAIQTPTKVPSPPSVHWAPDNVLADPPGKQTPKPLRSWNCHQCAFQGTNAKTLYNHIRASAHTETDDTKVTCYVCQQLCQDWNQMMIHRRDNHYNDLNLCRYTESGCRFSDRCFYRHTPRMSQNNVMLSQTPNPDFQLSPKETPPDQNASQYKLAEMQNQLKEMQEMQCQIKEILKI